jgi:hypothetical protein
MVRSESKPPGPPVSSDDLLITVVETAGRAAFALVRLEWRLLCWAAMFPMLSGPVALTVWAGVVGGRLAGGAVGTAFAMILVGNGRGRRAVGWSERGVNVRTTIGSVLR